MKEIFEKMQAQTFARKIVSAIAVVILTICFIFGTTAARTFARSDNGIKASLSIPDKNEVANESGWKVAQYEYRAFMNDLSAFPAW